MSFDFVAVGGHHGPVTGPLDDLDPTEFPPADQARLQEFINALNGPVTRSELSGLAGAAALFAATCVPTRRELRAQQQRQQPQRAIPKRMTAVSAAGGLAVTWAAAASFAGALPASLQSFAHDLFGAPAPSHVDAAPSPSATKATKAAPKPKPKPSTSPTDVPTPRPSKSATDASVIKGLCTAYVHEGLPSHSGGFAKLVVLAGGADHVKAFCAPYVKAGDHTGTGDHSGGSGDHKPTTTPTPKPTHTETPRPTETRTQFPRPTLTS